MTKFIQLLFIIAALSSCGNSTSQTTKANGPEKNIDSLIAEIKADDFIEVKEVYYNPSTEALSIAVTDRDKVISNNTLRVEYFTANYKIDDYTQVEGTYIYEYKKGKSLANGDYKTPYTYNSRKLGEQIDAWSKKYYSESGGYLPIHKRLETSLHDPASLEIVKVYEPDYNVDGYYTCVQDIRANNAFGAKRLQRVTAHIDGAGNILTFSIE